MSLRTQVAYAARSTYFSAKGYAVKAVQHGREFHRLLDELEAVQWLPADRLRDLQNRKLRLLVHHAYTQVPYYRDLFSRLGLTPDDIRDVSDLAKLPFLTKEDVRTHARRLVALNAPALFPGWTTGSTGTPLNALRTRTAIAFEHATIWRQRRWAGISLSDPNAAVWGTVWNDVIIPARSQHGPPYWRYNAANRQMLFSYYHLSDHTLPFYLEKLRRFTPASIEGFPSTLLILARALRARRETIPVKAVFTSSEPTFSVHRALIEEAFASRVFDLYGQAERVVCAVECDRHEGLHLCPEYGIAEIITDNREARPGESGELVGTGLNNFGMPLLRYRTGDRVTLARTPCSCGRAMPLLSAIDGRQADIIVTPDGRQIPGDGIMGAFHGITNIARSRVVQTAIDTLEVSLVADDPASPVDTARLIRNLTENIGTGVTIRCSVVPSLGGPTVGKSRWVVSLVGGTGAPTGEMPQSGSNAREQPTGTGR